MRGADLGARFFARRSRSVLAQACIRVATALCPRYPICHTWPADVSQIPSAQDVVGENLLFGR